MTDIQKLPARELADQLRKRTISSREAVDSHLDQIEAVNPAINAVVILEPDAARAAADAADKLAASGVDLPPMHGLPMTHKDTNMVAGMRSTYGSPIFAEHVPEADDLVIERLRRAGVIATGKTNVPEFGAGSHTFNEVFGATHNPYSTDVSAGGSSGGLAAALAAGIQPLGEGSDMGGSLRIPGSFCNVVGFRPSYGVLPFPSAVNNRSWLGRTGPMARTVDDIAFFLETVAGPDSRVLPSAPITGSDFAGLNLTGEDFDLKGVRIGWTPDFGIGIPVEQAVLDVLTPLLSVFEEAGATVEQACPDLSEADKVFQATRAVDFASLLGDFVRNQPEKVKPEVIWNVELGWSLTSQDLMDVTAARTRLDAATHDYFGQYDLLLSPGAQVLPFDGTLRFPPEVAGVPSETYLDWMRSACVLSAANLPVLAMPAGFTESGLPVGFQIASYHYRDADLLRWARAFELRNKAAQRRPDLITANA